MNFRGPFRVRADRTKALPEILHPNDAIVRVTRSCICGSDLHLYHGLVPDTRVGMTFGHEFTGIVEEVGSGVKNLKVGDHVLVPFNIACGACPFCKQELFGNCHESNPEATAVGGIFGYSHTAGGYDGGQAEYVRVPYADIGPTIIPQGMDIEDAVLLTDVTPTGYQAAEMAGIQKGDTVVVFGAGPIGIMAARCAWLFGAGRVIIIDHLDYRLEFARNYSYCEAYNFKEMHDPVVFLKKETGGLGADVCIDAVGCEAAGNISLALGHQFGEERWHHFHCGCVRSAGYSGADWQRGEQRLDYPCQSGLGKAVAAQADRACDGRPTESKRADHAPHSAGRSLRCLSHFLAEAG